MDGKLLSIQESESEHFVSLYFHIPFCSKKCPYCHFYVVKSRPDLLATFIPALLKEWESKRALLDGKVIRSIYLGGGTPSQLPVSFYQPLFDAIFNSSLVFHEDLEITFEANPEDLSHAYLAELRSLPINRLSLGVQSFDPGLLSILQRQHDHKRASEAILEAYQVGFTNLSIDLMYDLPHQTRSSWKQTLEVLKDLPISHLSLYNLTIEPHTSFYKKKKELTPHLPDEEKSLEFLMMALEHLEALGLMRYEISAFARDNLYSRHNTGYWLGREFHGYGPSAFSFSQGIRSQNISDLNHYIQHADNSNKRIGFTEQLEEEASLRERLIIRLRLKEGVFLKHFPNLPSSLKKEIADLKKEGYLEESSSFLKLTSKGFLFYDQIAATLV